ncbi:uncharacterized membrane protein YkvA (DUF1232 family)/predicted XRE-type DNA-binding protein [Paenibacillus castaneae]|uniref:DUF1232 domain-containing protein n=1 Tax=Paenibacillus castaneae TaxID=474957 RepID=UPI000C9ADAE2|nr:DUF1232 domain-containing protein [Paenibacillus castaneae]NIK75279.1 uncharacterized membrane protein YkvA (DUF1232 family)/predicted XRE-type DNA-binding protein [Paenibacillus castaneae]
MLEEKRETTLGETLISLLKARSLSMRKLSTLTGIDTATISRIVNGKQKAKPSHLEIFALHLGVPTAQLLQAAGFEVSVLHPNRSTNIHASIDSISEVLQASNLMNYTFTSELVQKELNKYEPYALTEEGQRIILNEFPAKVASVNGAGPFIDELKQMYLQYGETGIALERRAIIGSALLYFVLSIDVIPDYVFPLGYLDDAIAVQLVLDRLNHTPNTTVAKK